jgi:hypothetical protein
MPHSEALGARLSWAAGLVADRSPRLEGAGRRSPARVASVSPARTAILF